MKLNLIIWACVVTALTACNPENRTSTTTAEDYALSSNAWDDAAKQCEKTSSFAETDTTWGANLITCASISFDTTPGIFPLTITLDFGTEPCTSADGRARSGKLIYTLTGPYRQAGSVLTLVPDNYTVNDYRLEGTLTSTNQGYEADSTIVFKTTVDDGILTDADGNSRTYESSTERHWIEGVETGFLTWVDGAFLGADGITDDVYEITGTATGTDADGRAYEVEIETALRAELTCSHFVSGVLVIEPDGLDTRSIDYGTGTCDDQATVSIGRRSFDITLR